MMTVNQNEAAKINRLETTKLIGPMVDKHWEDLRLAKSRGQQNVWVAGTFYLLTSSQDIPTHFMAGFASYAAGRRVGHIYFKAAEEDYQLQDSCSYHRCHMGMLGLIRKGLPLPENTWIPLPDFTILSRICKEQAHYLESLDRQFGVPMIALDVPRPYSSEHIERNVPYVEEQLREVAIPSIEKLTGKPYNMDKLKEALVLLKKTALVRNDCIDLMKNVPAPGTIFDMCVSLAPIMYLAGKPGTLEYHESLKAELEDRVAKGIAAIPGEKYRLYWDHIMMWGWLGQLSRKLASYRANIVAARYPYGMHEHAERIDPDRPLWSIADQWAGGVYDLPEMALPVISKWTEEYRLDGLLMLSSPTCRLFNGGQLDIVDEINRKYGVPGIIFEGDMVDPHFYSEAQLDTRLQALFELIDGSRYEKSASIRS